MKRKSMAEVVNKLSKNNKECDFCGCGHCSSTPVTIKTVIEGKVAKLNTCVSDKEPIEIKGESAKVYEEYG